MKATLMADLYYKIRWAHAYMKTGVLLDMDNAKAVIGIAEQLNANSDEKEISKSITDLEAVIRNNTYSSKP